LSAIAIIGRSLAKVDEPGPVLWTDRFVLFCIAVLVTILQIFLYARGSGYGLLKLTDYFAFLGSVVIAVAAFQFDRKKRKFAGRAMLTAISAYCLVTFVEKQQILGRYGERTTRMPLPSTYKLRDKTGQTVSADLNGEPLNLFLYENRYQLAQILFHPLESYRFAPQVRKDSAGPQYLARLYRVGMPGTPIADITYPALKTPDALTVMPAEGQIHLLLPNPRWIAPEGEDASQLRRWLSVSGKFIIFGPLPYGRDLTFEVAAGPDFRQDNKIEIYVAGQMLRSIAPNELPMRVDVPLTTSLGLETEGEIRIVGLTAGIRQISVARLRSVSR
jgi:hypothetical protein